MKRTSTMMIMAMMLILSENDNDLDLKSDNNDLNDYAAVQNVQPLENVHGAALVGHQNGDIFMFVAGMARALQVVAGKGVGPILL